ncbi:alpha-galactosidase [Mucilaginibacter sp. UYNi724]
MLRRNFVKLSAAGFAAVMYSRLTFANAIGNSLINNPDEAFAQVNDQWIKLAGKGGSVFTYRDIKVEIKTSGNAQSVHVQAPLSDLQAIRFKWKYQTAKYTKVFGDHWERSYGDLVWRAPDANTKNPWYALLYDDNQTACFGVKTGANTMCYWEVKADAIELTMDTHSGGVGVKLGQRTLHAADIVTGLSKTNETPYATLTNFCKVMCTKPRLPKQPVYGINDWYVVYGKNSFQTIKDQTTAMAELVGDTNNRPFSVIDDGWQQPDDFSIVNDKFKDMHKMADEVKSHGMRPGLWTRPLIARKDDSKTLLSPKIPGRGQDDELILDPTIPENLARVKRNITLYKKWGYHMVKHDYSTWDIFGRWGMQMKDTFTAPGWKFYDQTKTNAEIMNQLYGCIREAAGDMYIIGCNTASHLSAGVFELNRIGDDTSGKEWARTKKMGVNTLGFRLPQNNTFYAADGDCVGITKDVPWDKTKKWLQLLAESGSPLFISAEIGFIGAEQKAAIKQAFANAARVQPNGEPLDWLTNQFPEKWKLNNREVTFNWD